MCERERNMRAAYDDLGLEERERRDPGPRAANDGRDDEWLLYTRFREKEIAKS